MSRLANARFDAWAAANEAGDTFRFDKVGGDRGLIVRAHKRLRELGCDPRSRDMLLLADVAQGICGLVEKAAKLDQLERIIDDTTQSDRATIGLRSRDLRASSMTKAQAFVAVSLIFAGACGAARAEKSAPSVPMSDKTLQCGSHVCSFIDAHGISQACLPQARTQRCVIVPAEQKK